MLLFLLLVKLGLSVSAGVEPSQRSWTFWRCSFFFFFWAFSEDSDRWGPDDSIPWTLGSSDRGSFMVLPWLLAMVELAGQLPRGQFWSIFFVLEPSRRADLTLASTAFLTIWLKLSSSKSQCSSSAKTEGFRPSWKYVSIIGLVRAPIGSYSNWIGCRCFRWAVQSNTNLAWY